MAHLPNWIQALAAAALVFLTWRTLLVLRGYAADTKTIAVKSVEQTENAQRPFLALVFKDDNTVRPHSPGGWGIENQGTGPAVNIYHSHSRGEQTMVPATPLAKDGFFRLGGYNRDVIERQGFTMTYQSLGGSSYTTTVTWVNGEMLTQFTPISQDTPE